MKFKLVIICCIAALTMGCAANPKKLYSKIDSNQSSVMHGSPSVIANATSIPLPTTIHGVSLGRKRFDITQEDPVIDFGIYKSNYKLFHFDLEKGDKYHISISSFCDCLGFDKRILVPNTYVIDSDGKTVETTMQNKVASLGIVEFILQGEANESGKYYLVFAANNSNPGARIGVDEAKVNGYIPTGIILSNSSNPYGKIMPSFEIISK